MLTILSAPIHSGKTTALQNFCKHYSAAGILMPDINNCRHIYNIATKQLFSIQKKEITVDSDIIIGKYIFDATIFAMAKQIIADLHNAPQQYLVIDEIGKLELNNVGLEPALSNFLLQINKNEKHIILTIRDYLLQETIKKYNLQHASVVTIQQFNTQFAL